MIWNRSNRTARSCKSGTFVLCCFLVGTALAERPILILDPYFYRTPVCDPIAGSQRTVIGYYSLDGDKLAPVSAANALPGGKEAFQLAALERARALLPTLKPEVFRDSDGVIQAIKLTATDPALTSIALLTDLPRAFADALGPQCIIAVPNRETILLLPALGGVPERLFILVQSLYHNSPWPVSLEKLQATPAGLKAVGTFEQ
jgi:hypothetical protein